MKKVIKEYWIAELRRRPITNEYNLKTNQGLNFLGLLCELYREIMPDKVSWVYYKSGYWYFNDPISTKCNNFAYMLSDSVKYWAGLESVPAIILTQASLELLKEVYSIDLINDYENNKFMTFSELAIKGLSGCQLAELLEEEANEII